LISNWREFTIATVLTHDLDPTYDFAWSITTQYGPKWRDRFLLHYLMFYDMGGAVECADQAGHSDFWDYVRDGYKDFTRGTERRHSRGDIGWGYVENLRQHGDPTQILDSMYHNDYGLFVKKMEREFKGCGFGPYFMWKVLDLQERVRSMRIDLTLDQAIKYMPEDPRKCAKSLWPDRSLKDVLVGIARFMREMGLVAPGKPNRLCGFQEAETILCMLKGYFITKTHTIGDDLESKYNSMMPYPKYVLHLPTRSNWSDYERPATLDPQTVSADLP
jgi:hypothetical protein